MKIGFSYISATILLMLSLSPALAQKRPSTECQKKVEAIVNSSETLRGAIVGIMAVTADGDPLVSVNADRMMVTASNMKLISTGAALHHLGGDYVYETRLGYAGDIIDGTLHGDVVVLGSGDPTLGSRDSIAVPSQRVFALWKSMLAKAGIRSIDGRVVGDGSAFDGMRESPAWQYEDIGTYYGTGGSGLSYGENVLRFRVQPGTEVGSPVDVRQMEPLTPWLDIRYDCTTGAKGTGDQLYLYTTDFADKAVLVGTYALGKAPKTIFCSNKYPELTCATEFARYLSGCGINGGTPAGDPKGGMTGGFQLLGTTSSPALREIARVTNYDSNNFYAETLARTLGRALTGSACYDSASVAVNRVLASMGLSTKYAAHIQDGSGLSRKNYVSPAFFCRFLAAMMDSPAWEDFHSSIPQAGVSGTVKGNLAGMDPSIRSCIRMKSGSMNGVRCYSGYYIPSEGSPVVFSVMVNNCTAKDSALKAVLDKIITAIVQ